MQRRNSWERVQPSDAGFAPDLLARLDQFAAQEANRNLHGVVVIRGGKLVIERYYEGIDQRWGQPLGTVAFTAETLHDLRSISKSIVGLMYGIALAEQQVPPLDQPLLDCFPDCADLGGEPMRRRMTVAHALSMQLGLAWDETLSYSDPRNSEIEMEQAPDRCRYVLERPLVAEPGTQWNYSGGATVLLARLITQGTGQSLLEYAQTKLFAPLGIEHTEWVADEHGVERAASGLRMRPRDAAKIGQLVLDRGRLGDDQVIPEAWIDASLTPHARIDDEFNYGYQWWLPTQWNWVGAFGNGGQRIKVLPQLGLVLVVTTGNYNQPEQWRVPVGVLVDVVLASLV